MTNIYIPNAVDPDHLTEVLAEMAVLGYPTVRVIDAGDHLIAIEGSHRITAASDLGLPVHTVAINDDETIDLDTLDWDDMGWFDERVISVSEFIDRFTRAPFPANCVVAAI